METKLTFVILNRKTSLSKGQTMQQNKYFSLFVSVK